MASKPYPQKRGGRFTGKWVCKWKPDPLGRWELAVLGDDPQLKSSRPPKNPPQWVTDRRNEFAEKEYRAKHGITLPAARVKSVASYVADYTEAYATGHKPGSVRQLRRHARDFCEFLRGRNVGSVQAVSKAVCREYVTARRAVASFDTVKTEVRYLSPIWTQAVDDGLVAVNPWSKIKVPGKSSKSAGTVWTDNEVAKIAAACAKAWQTELVKVLANTGLRISTALEMRWDWVRWREDKFGVIHIPQEAAAELDGVKTSYTHILSPHAHTLLAARHAVTGDGLVFPNPYGKPPGGVVPYDSARNAIQQAIARAGVRFGTPHDLRRTYATLLYRKHRDLVFVKRQLGHTSIMTTQKYLGVVESDDAAALADFVVGEFEDDATLLSE